MKKTKMMVMLACACLCVAGCSKEKSGKDRSDADEMFRGICRLTIEYTEKLRAAPDSADWAAIGSEYEERLDKINFSFPPDTDLLLTEGQNDTIHTLMRDYVNARRERIHGILHRAPELDSAAVSDSLDMPELNEADDAPSGDASRSRGN